MRTTTRRIRTAAVLVWLGLALAIIVRVQDRRDWVRKDQPASERFLALSSINKDAALDVDTRPFSINGAAGAKRYVCVRHAGVAGRGSRAHMAGACSG